jgi:hypothetical protein
MLPLRLYGIDAALAGAILREWKLDLNIDGILSLEVKPATS